MNVKGELLEKFPLKACFGKHFIPLEGKKRPDQFGVPFKKHFRTNKLKG